MPKRHDNMESKRLMPVMDVTRAKWFAQDYLAHETLIDGSELKIRAIRPQDKSILQEGMHHLAPDSLYFRFLMHKKELSKQELSYFTELDFLRHVGLLAIVVDHGTEVPAGVGRYIVTDKLEQGCSAELAFAVDEKYQGHGIATHLLKHLAIIARAEGLEAFTARVLSDNVKMLRVFENCGLSKTQSFSDSGTLEIRLSLK